MTKQQAIRKFCLGCGGTTKDVALCTDPYCVLWPFRLGYGLKSKSAVKYMNSMKERYPKEVEELAKYGLEVGRYFKTLQGKSAPRISRLNDLDAPGVTLPRDK